ncbi:MAG: hypothetical protein JST00_04615 [Deltaproteobacteria bacterium]|nr:hypothetical protein [Deltaproteobacteria bacterium]
MRSLLLPLAAAVTLVVTAGCSVRPSEPVEPTAAGSPTAPADAGTRPAAAAGGFRVTVSGEDYAATGFDFTPGVSTAYGDPPAFVDGWSIRFEHILVTVANVEVHAEPDLDPTNAAKVGASLARDEGAYAVDLVRGGDVAGKSGAPRDRAVAITELPGYGPSSTPFDPGARYAFGYETVAASAAAKRVNLDAAGEQLYAEAIAKGWAMVYVGTATYEGPPPDPSSVFAKMPSKVSFRLGFANPASYRNCRNTDLPKVGGKYPRGIRPSADGAVTVQITFHTDHVFWNRLDTDGTPLFFDAIAASSPAFGGASGGAVTMDDLARVDITDVRSRSGERVPPRSHVADYAAPSGPLVFDAQTTRFARPNAFSSFLSYAAVSTGHMNAFGVCEIERHFVP